MGGKKKDSMCEEDLTERMQACYILRNQNVILSSLKEWGKVG